MARIAGVILRADLSNLTIDRWHRPGCCAKDQHLRYVPSFPCPAETCISY